MSVPQHDFVWQQGEDGVVRAVYKQNGLPVNLTGYKVRMDVRSTTGALVYVFNSDDIVENPVVEGVDETGVADNEAVLGTDGSITISIPRAASLGSGPFVSTLGEAMNYDVFLRDTSNKQRKILKGTIVFEPSATRWN